MIEKWRRNIDKRGSSGTYTVLHMKLYEKLPFSGTHRTEMNNSHSLFLDLLIGVPPGSILGALLFNIYICDVFFFIEEEIVTCNMWQHFLNDIENKTSNIF